ncbi:DUF4129 domain-containing protein [Haloarchaeobius sp. HRN-SO-5]|uniref:DUF4129 domain-containing protein n=1 Tax=Haloarchaeobius sp. HRN-SO-5 TaxID=3446118 RepID=UPI003EC050CA
MGYDLSRAAVVCVSVFAVLLAASLFPASGFGAYPGSVSDGAADPGSPAGFGDLGGDDSVPTATPSESGSQSGEITTRASTTTRSSETTTATATETDSSAANDVNTGGGDFDAGQFVLTVVLGFVTLGAVALFLLIIAEVERIESSDPDGFDGWVVDIPGLPTFRVRASFLAVPQGTMAFLVGLTASAPRVLDGIGETTSNVFSGLDALASGLGSATSALAVGVPTALARGFVSIPRGLAGGFGSLSLGMGAITEGISARNWLSRRRDKPADPRSGTAAESAEEGPEDTGPMTIEEAWAAMVEEVPLGRPSARTPAEHARAAIENGLPSEPVRRLTAVFRQVRYGDYPPSDDRTHVARDAIDQIRRRLEGDG